MVELESLSEEEQYKVYWLAQHLLEEGIEGIYFKKEMREYLEQNGEDDLEQIAEAKLRNKTI